MKLSYWYNPLIVFLLRSPLHGMLSQNMMLVTVTGKKSGKRLTIPVNYLCKGGEFFTVSWRNRTWWRNLRGSAPAILRVKGQALQSVGEAITDDVSVTAELARYLGQMPHYAKYFRVALDTAGKPNPAEVALAARERVMVRFRVCQK